MVNIYFIHRFPFTKDAYIRDEFDYFTSKGYTVLYLDISSLLKKLKIESTCPPELNRFVISFSKRHEFDAFIQSHKENSIIVTDVGLLANSAWMYVSIFRAQIPYIVFENTVFPRIIAKETYHSIKIDLIKFFRRLHLKKVLMKPQDLYDFMWAVISKIPAKMIITSRSSLSSEIRSLQGKQTTIKYTVSLDYRLSSNLTEDILIPGNYAVFIDQYFVHHPDFKTNHIISNFSEKEYYGELNKYLKAFSDYTGLKVIIAAHPRRSSARTNDFLPEFELFYNKTAELIKGSSLVLLHFSTAISFAVIFNRPFLLLSSRLFKTSNIHSEIEKFASYFHSPSVIMSDEIEHPTRKEPDIYRIDMNRYENYMNNFIKHPKSGDETFRELVESQIFVSLKSRDARN